MMIKGKHTDKCAGTVLILSLLVTVAVADDKWVWSGDRQGADREHSSVGGSHRSGKFGGSNDRYDVTEQATRRTRIEADEFGDFNNGNSRYNFNAFGRPGPGFGPPVPPQENLYPNPQNGILVGPGGPTGIIGRPRPGISPINGLQGHPSNGILVGPGGPTGIIGRPPRPIPGRPGIDNVGPQVFPTIPGGPNNQPLFPRPIPPGPGGLPSAYPSGIYPGGGIPPSPGAYPGGYPVNSFPNNAHAQNYYLANYNPFRSRSAASFDEYDEISGRTLQTDSAKTVNKNILKKSVTYN